MARRVRKAATEPAKKPKFRGTIGADVAGVLSEVTFSDDGKTVTLPSGQLDRKLYVGVNKVLAAAGGKWNRGQQAHVFDNDAREKISAMLEGGGIVDEKKDAGFFATPFELAKELVSLANVQPGQIVLEPSAGQGAIIDQLLDVGATVECCELLKNNRKVLESRMSERLWIRVKLLDEPDFDKIKLIGPYARVVMNPPFDREIEHVMKAHFLLCSDGVLVSVMSSGVMFRIDKKRTAFRKFVKECGGRFIENESKSFSASGTNVNTVTLVLPAAPVVC